MLHNSGSIVEGFCSSSHTIGVEMSSFGVLLAGWIDGIGEIVGVFIEGAREAGFDNSKDSPLIEFNVMELDISSTIELESLSTSLISFDGDLASILRLVWEVEGSILRLHGRESHEELLEVIEELGPKQFYLCLQYLVLCQLIYVFKPKVHRILLSRCRSWSSFKKGRQANQIDLSGRYYHQYPAHKNQTKN